MSEISFLNPKELGKPLGPYSQVARARVAEHLFIAGQVGVAPDGRVAEGFEAQCEQLYANIATALKAMDAGWNNIVQFTSYLVNAEDIPAYMTYRARAYPTFFPSGVYPTHTLVLVKGLVQKSLLVEVTAAAVFA